MLCFILFQLGAMTSRFSTFSGRLHYQGVFATMGYLRRKKGSLALRWGLYAMAILTKLRFLLIRYNIRTNIKVWYPQTLRGLIN